ncbi:MAG: biopolymer transporter ExbD [Planctomycetota bacterium]
MLRPPQPARMILNLAPMVDVMMCLIIFFLLASKMVSAAYRIEPPWAVAAREVAGSDLGNRVTITVGRQPADPNEPAYVVTDWDGRQIVERMLSPDEVEGLIRTRAARAAGEGHKLSCVIRADRLVRYQHVEHVLRACGLARVSDVVFAANKGEPPKEPA